MGRILEMYAHRQITALSMLTSAPIAPQGRAVQTWKVKNKMTQHAHAGHAIHAEMATTATPRMLPGSAARTTQAVLLRFSMDSMPFLKEKRAHVDTHALRHVERAATACPPLTMQQTFRAKITLNAVRTKLAFVLSC